MEKGLRHVEDDEDEWLEGFAAELTRLWFSVQQTHIVLSRQPWNPAFGPDTIWIHEKAAKGCVA